MTVFKSFLTAAAVATSAALLGSFMPLAVAQSTGNPKGSAAPPSSDTEKAGAQRRPSTADGNAQSGPLRSDMGPAEARMKSSRSPGTGTAGGLPKRTPGDGGDASRNGPPSQSTPTRQPAAPAGR